jgi:6-phosphogluconate dehydrogenase (decarboxylating)
LPEAVPADVITTALYARFRSRQEHTFGEKMLSAVRFGLIRGVTWLRGGDLTSAW